MSLDRVAFDRELTLGALLGGAAREVLAAALAALLPPGYRLTDAEGHALAASGTPAHATVRIPIRMDFDCLGHLEGPAEAQPALAAAAQLVALIARQLRRYQMAADLHLEAVREDHLALLEQNRRLQESEARYKALAASLEVRVAEQVRQLDAHRRQLYEAEKKASVGQLAAGMAHEINNPLGFIRSNLATGRKYLDAFARLAAPVRAADGDAARAAWEREDFAFVLEDFGTLLAESAEGAGRIARIVASLKEFSSIDRAGLQQQDLARLLESVCRVAAPQVERSARLELDLERLPAVTCDGARIGQAVLNLLLNAAQAVGEAGRVRVSARGAAGEVRISVSDNGCGIPADVLPRIFEPFFTTRDVGGGTGLGLTAARDVAEAHGGRIEVESRPGEGATFTLVLPCAATAGAAAA